METVNLSTHVIVNAVSISGRGDTEGDMYLIPIDWYDDNRKELFPEEYKTKIEESEDNETLCEDVVHYDPEDDEDNFEEDRDEREYRFLERIWEQNFPRVSYIDLTYYK